MLWIRRLSTISEVKDACSSSKDLSCLGVVNCSKQQRAFALGTWRRLNDMDVLHSRGLVHQCVSYPCGAPRFDSERLDANDNLSQCAPDAE